MNDNTWLTNTAVAHRGLHNEQVPENTLEAFQLAVDSHYGIEMDLQMTADGQIVVFHDDNMKRLTGLDADIREQNWDDIKQLGILGSQQTIPTFTQFLELVNGAVPLIIEIKDHKNIGVAEHTIATILDNYKGEYCIESFNPFIVKWWAENRPDTVRGQLSCYFRDSNLAWYKKIMLKNLFFIRSNKSQFIAYDIDDIATPMIKRLKKRLPIIAWTVRSQQEIDNKREYFDNIIFEHFTPRMK
ncbi:MAG: glycerophosphodiester phosphodiesterase family protein [Clostridia bacterium]|nr:glycerophosphodiester phosphodiesterase family protein [Clostridia bacterium]